MATPDYPAALGDLGGDERIAIVGRGLELAAEGGLRVGHEDGRVEFAVVIDQERLVVGDELREQSDQEDRQEDPERPVAARVGAEVVQAPARERRDLPSQEAVFARSGLGGGAVLPPEDRRILSNLRVIQRMLKLRLGTMSRFRSLTGEARHVTVETVTVGEFQPVVDMAVLGT